MSQQPKEEKIDHVEMFNFYINEIRSLEYINKYNIDVVIGTLKQKKETQIVTEEQEMVACTRLQLVVKGECLYMRTVEGIDDKAKYYCAYFTYRDILNSGVQLTFLIWEDQKRVVMEIAEKQKNKFQA